MLNSFPIEVKPCQFGRGVFSTRDIPKGGLIEVAPVLPLTPKEFNDVSETLLGHYVYTWIGPRQKLTVDQDKWTGAALVLGYGMIYNHSSDPNCEWKADAKDKLMRFYALRTIPKGTEIFHNYHWPDWLYEQEGIPVPPAE